MNLWIPLGAIAIYFLMNEKRGFMLNKNQIDKIIIYGKLKHNLDFKNYTIVGIIGGDIKNESINPIPNIRNQFNDILAIIKGDKILAYKANLEPGNPSLNKPINTDGTFQILEGHYKVKRTSHGRDIIRDGQKIRIREKAFNVINPTGQRDKNKDKVFDSKDPILTLNASFGINIHPTNRRNPKTVDGSSYGCLNLQAYWEDATWEEFRNTLYNDTLESWDLMIVDAKKII